MSAPRFPEPGEPSWLVAFALCIEAVAVVGILVLIGLGDVQDSVGLSTILGILGVTRSLAKKAKSQATDVAGDEPAGDQSASSSS